MNLIKKIGAFFLLCFFSLSLIPFVFSIIDEMHIQRNESTQSLQLEDVVEQTKNKCEDATASGKSLLPLLNKNSDVTENVSYQDANYTEDYSIVLYDFEETPSFVYVQFKNGGYAITNIETGNIYERAEIGVGPYDEQKTKKCYYGGVENYFYRNNNQILTIKDNICVNQFKNSLQENLSVIKEREKEYIKQGQNTYSNAQKNLENTSFRNNVVTIGNHNLSDGDFALKKSLYFPMLSANMTKKYYYEDSHGFTDFLFPINDRNSCAFVAITMFLQFYERLDNGNTIPPEFDTDLFDYLYKSTYDAQPDKNDLVYLLWKNNNTKYDVYSDNYKRITNDNADLFINGKPDINTILKSNMVKTQKLHNFLYSIGDQGSYGETYNTGIVTCMERFYNIYPDYRKFTFTANSLWANIKECIDWGMPSFGMTGLSATGFFPNTDDSSYASQSVARHQMLIYGYTVNSIGGPDEFICHSGWHETNPDNHEVRSMVFTSGWSFAGNVTIREI